MHSRIPVARSHLTAAALTLYRDAAEGHATPEVERAARLVDDALRELDAASLGRDVRPPAPSDWGVDIDAST